MWPTVILLMLSCFPVRAALRAGAAAADITPQEWPVRLIGGFSLDLAQSAHDPLYARAIVLEEGSVRIAIALIDSCYVKREELDRIKELASKRTAIPTSRMMIAATHTHSAPPSRAQANDQKEIRYVNRLVEQTAEAIVRANQNLQEAKLGWAAVPVPEELYNRRWYLREGSIEPNPFGERSDLVKMNPRAGSPELLHPAGSIDPEFFVLSIQSKAGKPLALLANYSLHYVGGVPPNQVSADYFGEFSRLVAQQLAPADSSFVALLTNGTSGDVNNINFLHPRPRSEPFERIRAVAGRLATHAVRLANRISYEDSAPVRMQQQILRLRYRKPTPEQLRFAQAALEQDDESKLPPRAKAYAQRALALERGPEFADLKLQALRIGPVGITAIPCEVFTETGLTIKELSPLQPTFTIELANGHYGYLPTRRHYALGGYETWLGTNNLEPEASAKITRTLLALLEEVAK
ncbi:MAG: neutral/alkaline non-lysosomal ceramidase N-terminal domain-containing protein [Bryobacteraceae bacterium]|nr:neutral/alkaline non-lysosomal ceramidase N-terminal domain-containing protein [Bryobacteraceae bacterium]MDW8379800.1 neutral/alkaline non-lysosomal ceramidase N-terminal domain-containing protein [Bryobacterales bacterium]